MIAIVVRWPVRPEHVDRWPEVVRAFTQATRAEPGCLWFEWSRSLEEPDTFVLVEGFRDADAGAAHTGSEHFARAMRELGAYVAARPKIISVETDGDGWSELGELEL